MNEHISDFTDDYPKFTPAMKKTHTVLVPAMLPIHFRLFKHVLGRRGYRVEPLENEGRQVIDEGLKHVHNDACFPALCVIGQYLDALKSGKYDPDRTAVLITQSGGGCRASNYVPLIRKALKAEFPQVPVLSFNFSGLEKGSGVEMSLGLIRSSAFAILYGDLAMTCYYRVKPYERDEGAADACLESCLARLCAAFDAGKEGAFRSLCRSTLKAFSAVPVREEEKLKVGVVGEIYVKYSPLGNAHLADFLLSEGCEPVFPPLCDFVLYCIVNNLNDAKFYGKRGKSTLLYRVAYRYFYGKQRALNRMIRRAGGAPLHDFEDLRALADRVIHQGVKMGEGWLIPAEMAAFAETGTENIVCAQPFGCLPNHIVGKGAIRVLKEHYPNVNIVPVDFDPSASKVNQENRIKLMLGAARSSSQILFRQGQNKIS